MGTGERSDAVRVEPVVELCAVASLRGVLARAAEAGGEAIAPAGFEEGEVLHLATIARQVRLLSRLGVVSAPAALDSVLEMRGSRTHELDREEERGVVGAEWEDQDRELEEWLSILGRVQAPSELDVRVESELEHVAHRVAARDGFAVEPPPATSVALPRVLDPTRSRLPQAWARRSRQALLIAAALVFLAGLGLVIRSMISTSEESLVPGTDSSRFSFHYVEVDLASSQDAQRPVLRLLRGWASHIGADASGGRGTKK